jgi:hypothetical protein
LIINSPPNIPLLGYKQTKNSHLTKRALLILHGVGRLLPLYQEVERNKEFPRLTINKPIFPNNF